MTDRPPLTEMLEFARKEMRTTIRSALPEEHKYSALMIANLLAIAVRTLETDPGEREILLRTLQGLTKSEIRDKEGLEAFPDEDLEILGRKILEIDNLVVNVQALNGPDSGFSELLEVNREGDVCGSRAGT